ncbi:MAG: hypothetical protein ACOH1O_06355 [Flavobacterium sp.]
MKKLSILLVLVITLSTTNLFAQEFYPLNLISLISDENLPENKIITVNDYQLIEKGFAWEDDNLYVNNKSTEIVKFSANKEESNTTIRIDYYTVATDLSRFANRAGKSGLDKVNENLFEKKFPNISYQIEIKRNITFKGKKYNLLSFICSHSLPEKEVIFRNNNSYPLQNSTWYFETDLQDDKSNPDEYILGIKMSEEKKYNDKVEFIDDANFKVTLASKQTFTGTYNSGFISNGDLPSIYFELTKPKTPKGHVESLTIIGLPDDVAALRKAKNTLRYYQYFFNRRYDYKIEQNGLTLSAKINENMPIFTTVPKTE